MFFNFLGADILVPKSRHRCEKQPVLGPGKPVVKWVLKSPKTNNRIVEHLDKWGLFSDFKYGFRYSRSTADLLTVVSDRIARANQVVALDISKAFDRI